MNQRLFLLSIPVEPWAAEDFVPAAASEAVALAAQLTDRVTSLDELTIRCQTEAPAPTEFNMSATLLRRHGPDLFSTSIHVQLDAFDAEQRCLAEITIRATTRWDSPTTLEIEPDTAQTLALSFGCLDPVSLAARTVRVALAMLGIDAEVTAGPNLELNRNAVREISAQPPMSSDNASPLNPYALEGIAGWEAERWVEHGFPAAMAGPWARNGFEPPRAIEWSEYAFAADEASRWSRAGARPEEAEECRDFGVPLEVFKSMALQGQLPVDYADLLGVVPVKEIPSWIDAIESNDLLETSDVKILVSEGFSAWDVARAPSDLTALQVVRYLDDPFNFDQGDDDLT